jgi:hypothetical protein
MMTKWACAASATVLLSIGCTSATSGPLDDGSGGGATTTSGHGGGGGGASTGAGGQGGAPSECPQDCSKVQVPPCLLSVCDPASKQCKVVPDPNPTPCDDGQYCTVGETCLDGKCQGGASNDCGIQADPCTAVTCKEATKSCVKEPQSDGTPCANTDLCTVNAQCKAGQCVGSPKDCFFAPGVDDCHVGTCDPKTGKCNPSPGNDGQPCKDAGDLCNENKTCSQGNCTGGTPVDCSYMGSGCDAGVCDPKDGSCTTQPIAAGGSCPDAADECNAGLCDANGTCNPSPLKAGTACQSAADECNAAQCDGKGACVAVPLAAGTACQSAVDACNTAQCDGKGLCAPHAANEGKSCNDGNTCTVSDACVAGVCSGTPDASLVTYFADSFADNGKGWVLGKEWQIGPAKASPGKAGCSSYEDPAHDHTHAGDNGIAGVDIGGYADISANHDYYYLESPVIDTSAAAGSIYLQFWRWLNTDGSLWMANDVECWDGAKWRTLWESDFDNDSAWTPFSYDITACKGAGTKVRFGMSIVDYTLACTESSWNLDDVAIVSKACF